MADDNKTDQPESNIQPPLIQPEPDQTEKLLSALGYLGLLCILPLVLKRDSKFCQLHGKQALVLAIFDLGLRVTIFLGWLYGVITIVYFVIIVLCMIRAFRGDYFELPVVSELAKSLKF